MQRLKNELFELLRSKGAVLMGAADMADSPFMGFDRAVCVAMPVPERIVRPLTDMPTREYMDMYNLLNERLNCAVEAGAEFLRQRGYSAFANTTKVVERGVDDTTPMPHKTAAVKAGLGWIGKSCLLVTERFGGAVRISTLFTDAPLPCDEPILESRCPPECRICADACPAGAIYGEQWREGMERSRLFDHEKCLITMKSRMMQAVGVDFDICGKCFAVCPFTRRYLESAAGAGQDRA